MNYRKIILIVIIAAGLAISIFIYRMPYPAKMFWDYIAHGPEIPSGITSNEYKDMWALIRHQRGFYEIPLSVTMTPDGFVNISTILSCRNPLAARGRVFTFFKESGKWKVYPSQSVWIS